MTVTKCKKTAFKFCSFMGQQNKLCYAKKYVEECIRYERKVLDKY